MHLMSYNITPRPSPTLSFRADEGPLRTGGSGVTNGQPWDGTRRPVTFQVLNTSTPSVQIQPPAVQVCFIRIFENRSF